MLHDSESHVRLLFLLACGLMLCRPSLCWSHEPIDREHVASLVEQLGSAELKTRVAAERELRDLGPGVLLALPDPRTLPPSAGEAVKRIRTYLDRQQARALLLAHRVTLSGRLSLVEAITAIADQTGNTLDVAPLSAEQRARRLSFDLQDVPFWDAVNSIEQQAGVVAVANESRNALIFRERLPDEPVPLALSVAGPFRVSMIEVRTRPGVPGSDKGLLRLTCDVAVEPRLRLLFVHVTAADISVSAATAADNKAATKPFPPLSPKARLELPVDRPGPIRVTHFVLLPRSPSHLPPMTISLGGTFDAELAAGRERFDFRHLDEQGPVTRRHGGVAVTLDDVQYGDGQLRASLRLTYDADGPRFESHRSWVFHNDVRLRFDDGRTIAPTEFVTLDEGEGGVTLRYRFTGVDTITDETQLSYTAPTLITRVPVEFVFDNVTVSE